jgi:tetratricopeptide (TPR) repeat protein
MTFVPKIYIDENLRDRPEDPEALLQHVNELIHSLDSMHEPEDRVSTLGEIGVYLRILGELDEAEVYLLEALEIIGERQLGIKKEVQQMIRLSHVLQWQKEFSESTKAFEQIVEVCRQDEEAHEYLDLALQHAGKNLFDQEEYFEALGFFYEALQLRKSKGSPQDQIESTETAIRVAQGRLRQ